MLQTAYEHPGPAMVRYPRDAASIAAQSETETLPLGKGELRRQGRSVALLAFGTLLAPALEVAESLDATVANMRFVKPLDADLVLDLAGSHDLLVTLEENVVAGGAGSGVSELLSDRGIDVPCLHLGLPDRFMEQATRQEQLSDCGLDAAGIEEAVRSAVAEISPDLPRSRSSAGL
jgi:1-deoxy-D-xylulose-5-phosphate synthase